MTPEPTARGPQATPYSIRIKLSSQLDDAAIRALHPGASANDWPDALRGLLSAAKVQRMTEVHPITDGPIDDPYGFAREFVCYLQPGSEVEQTLQVLRNSPLIETARPMHLGRAFDPDPGSGG